MPATPDSRIRTHAFARVIGPWLIIVPGIIVIRAPDIQVLAAQFFENSLIVWSAGALLLLGGLFIIAFHQHWSSAPAIAISLFGWLLALRGFALLAFPQLIERGAAASVGALPLVRAGFGAAVLIGLWLTYIGWSAKLAASPSKDHG